MSEMKLYEVFIRAKAGLNHRHVGSLHASDAEMALLNARDVYTRRKEGVSIWVVEAEKISSSNPEQEHEWFDPAEDKVYRYPTFYPLDKEVENM
jgi:ring-1,2-phenylacetyl-CoA epoxidase subunit PaaB